MKKKICQKKKSHKAEWEYRHVPSLVQSCHLPDAGTKELFVLEDWGQLKAKLGSTGSMLTIFRVSAFEQP